jgi:hypothetical protein
MATERDVGAVGAVDATHTGFSDDKPEDKLAYATDLHPNPDDPEAPSEVVSSKRQRISDFITIIAAGAGLASDGYVQLGFDLAEGHLLTHSTDTRIT